MSFESDLLSVHMAKLDAIQLPWFDQHGEVKDEDFEVVRKKKPKRKITNTTWKTYTELPLAVHQDGDGIPTTCMPTQDLFCTKDSPPTPVIPSAVGVTEDEADKWKRIDEDLRQFLQDEPPDNEVAVAPSPLAEHNPLGIELANATQDVLAIMSSGDLFPCQQLLTSQQQMDAAKIETKKPGRSITSQISK